MAGASLTIVGGGLAAGSVAGGAGGASVAYDGSVGPDGGNGEALGGGIFLQSDFLQGVETITLAPASGTTETISGVIADQTGGTRGNGGAGGLTLSGAGTLVLAAANTYTGGTTIDKGILELTNTAGAGGGGITFASTSGEIEYSAGADLSNAIAGFGGKDKIDFSTIAYAKGDHAVDSSGNVSIETRKGLTVAAFNVSGDYTSANFHIGADASGDVLVTYVATPAATASEAAISSPTDLLGGYGSQFAEPPQMPAFDSLTLLAPSAAADSGAAFSLNDGNGGIFGGARDAVDVAVGWKSSTGHGPGPSS
jgi:autotransporter-associated beta strand protein